MKPCLSYSSKTPTSKILL